MPPYKRQHYLPAGYLKFFAADPNRSSRSSAQVWRIDKNGQRLVPIQTQCAKDYHYSKNEAEAAEREFHVMEDRYCRCVEAFTMGHEPDDLDTGGLLMSMFTLYLRNAVHVNNKGKEGIEAYRSRFWTFLQNVLLCNHTVANADTLQAELSLNWGLRVLLPPSGRLFLTSDNPSVWTSVFGSSDDTTTSSSPRKIKSSPMQLITLPITPRSWPLPTTKPFSTW